MPGANPLLSLLQECVIQIDTDDGFRGSGFFIAPGEAVTCAHVVEGLVAVTVSGPGWAGTATVKQRAPNLPTDAEIGFQLPDLALLDVVDAPADHPCVRLADEAPQIGTDGLYLRAYTQSEYEPAAVAQSGASVRYEGGLTAEIPVLKFSNGQVIGGYSGCPALRRRTGSVVAVVDSSRNERTDLGGFGVPVAALGEAFEGALDRNTAFHQGDTRWEEAHRDERTAEKQCETTVRPLTKALIEIEWAEGDPPSKMLRPRYGVVDMTGREVLLGRLMRWRESEKMVEVALLTGGGGYGKTRLALEECAAAEVAGWTAGLFTATDRGSAVGALQEIAAWPGRIMIVVDYAETRPGVVNDLLHHLLSRVNGAPARILLVCRQDMDREELENSFALDGDREQIQEALRNYEPVRLDEREVDRQLLFKTGTQAIAAVLGIEHPGDPSPALDGDHFERPLFVLAAALLWLEDPTLDVDLLERDDLMLEMLEKHEARYWERWNAELGLGLDPGMQRRVVAAAAALGAESEEEALTLVASVPGLEKFDAGQQREIAIWLSHLYDDGDLTEAPAIAPLEPDSLAEVLITDEYRSTPELLARSFGAAAPAQRARFQTMVTRASTTEGKTAPMEFALDVLTHAVDHYEQLVAEDEVKHRPEHAARLLELAKLQQEARLFENAMETMEEAVKSYRLLSAEEPELYNLRLAMALNRLGVVRVDVGDSQGALEAIEESLALLDLDGSDDGS